MNCQNFQMRFADLWNSSREKHLTELSINSPFPAIEEPVVNVMTRQKEAFLGVLRHYFTQLGTDEGLHKGIIETFRQLQACFNDTMTPFPDGSSFAQLMRIIPFCPLLKITKVRRNTSATHEVLIDFIVADDKTQLLHQHEHDNTLIASTD